MNIIKAWIEDFKAYKRGEKRVAPKESTGRVYKSKSKVTLDKVRVYRAKTDKWETIE